jgi:hypothetical protein
MALGLSLTTFATGFPNPPQEPTIGPMGITFTHSHKVMVGDRTGTLYVFPTDVDGQTVADPGVIHHDFGYDNTLGLASLDGFTRHFMDEEHDGKVVELDDSGSVVGMPLASGLNYSALAADPLRDLLYSTTIFGQAQIIQLDPNGGSHVFLNGVQGDGIAFSTDRHVLFISENDLGMVASYDTLTGQHLRDYTGIPGRPDGVAVGTGTGPLFGNIYVNTNGGTVEQINIDTGVRTTIAEGGSRGDLIAVDPWNDCLLVTQSDRIMRICPPAKGGTSTTLASSAPPSVSGQPVTFTATVTPVPPALGTPTGTVTFWIDGTAQPPVSLSGGRATYTTAGLSVGSHTIGASYSGDSNFNPSAASLTQTVNKADTTTSLDSLRNPSIVGDPVTFTAMVSAVAPGAGIPSGTVTFYDGSTVLSTAALNSVAGTDQATFSTSGLSLGTHAISATYNGDGNFNGSTSNSFYQGIILVATSMTLDTSNPASVLGDPVTFTATVTPSLGGHGVPMGTVTFYDYSTILGTASLNGAAGTAQATFSASALTLGTHLISASYAGGGVFDGSSAALYQDVILVGTSMTLATSNPDSVLGDAVTFTATVTPSLGGHGVPMGTVTFYDYSTILGTASLNGAAGTAQATFSTSALTLGTHLISASYDGGGVFDGSSAALYQDIYSGGSGGSARAPGALPPPPDDLGLSASVLDSPLARTPTALLIPLPQWEAGQTRDLVGLGHGGSAGATSTAAGAPGQATGSTAPRPHGLIRPFRAAPSRLRRGPTPAVAATSLEALWPPLDMASVDWLF